MKINVKITRTGETKKLILERGSTVGYLLEKIKVKPDTIIVMSDNKPIPVDDILTETVAKQLFFPLLMLTGKGWTLRCIKEESSHADFFGSSICITYKSLKAASIWACPKECCLIEFQQELDIRGEIQHLAHVSEMKAWVLLLSKGSTTDVQEQMAVQLGKWLKKNGGEIVMG